MAPLLAASGRFCEPVWHPQTGDGDRLSGVQDPAQPPESWQKTVVNRRWTPGSEPVQAGEPINNTVGYTIIRW